MRYFLKFKSDRVVRHIEILPKLIFNIEAKWDIQTGRK